MKSLLIKTNGAVELVDFPEENKLNWYYEQIGCDCIDIVSPYGLEEIAETYDLRSLLGKFCIICDDEALLKEKPEVNVIASLLYGVDSHGQPLCGNVLIAKNEYTPEGVDSVGLEDVDLFLMQAAINSLIEMHNDKVGKGHE